VLTKEMELVKHGELVAELRWSCTSTIGVGSESHRVVFQSAASVWMTAWPSNANVQAG
jgi:hypothetical protein